MDFNFDKSLSDSLALHKNSFKHCGNFNNIAITCYADILLVRDIRGCDIFLQHLAS